MFAMTMDAPEWHQDSLANKDKNHHPERSRDFVPMAGSFRESGLTLGDAGTAIDLARSNTICKWAFGTSDTYSWRIRGSWLRYRCLQARHLLRAEVISVMARAAAIPR
jgi:hypothetical protein